MSMCVMEQGYSKTMYTAQDNKGFTVKLSAQGINTGFQQNKKFSILLRGKVKYELFKRKLIIQKGQKEHF